MCRVSHARPKGSFKNARSDCSLQIPTGVVRLDGWKQDIFFSSLFFLRDAVLLLKVTFQGTILPTVEALPVAVEIRETFQNCPLSPQHREPITVSGMSAHCVDGATKMILETLSTDAAALCVVHHVHLRGWGEQVNRGS